MFPPNTVPRGAAALALLGAPLLLTACDSGEPEDGAGEEELITQVVVTLTNADDASDSVTITASDDDGDGDDVEFSDRIALRPGATYEGSIRLRDTINDEEITEEIEDEAEEHLFRYAFDPASAGDVTITDVESDYTAVDENGGDFAVGLDFRAEVADGASGDGTLDVLLYHFDDGPKTSSTDTSDELDVDLAFPVSFEAPAAVAGR
jgi:hypothetical protein